jgi:hypothetical protein
LFYDRPVTDLGLNPFWDWFTFIGETIDGDTLEGSSTGDYILHADLYNNGVNHQAPALLQVYNPIIMKYGRNKQSGNWLKPRESFENTLTRGIRYSTVRRAYSKLQRECLRGR